MDLPGYLKNNLGLLVKDDWLASCLQGVRVQIPNIDQLSMDQQAQQVLNQFLHADMNFVGGGIVPDVAAGLPWSNLTREVHRSSQ